MSILEHICNLIAQKGSGFYCIITINNEITDVFKVVTDGKVVTSILSHGDSAIYGTEDIANMIEMEGAGDGFVFMGDIINIPEPTDQEIAHMMGEAGDIPEPPAQFNEPNIFSDDPNEEQIVNESVPDLVGYENMDYTIGEKDHVNKDREIE